jgi:hypothetical protein
MANELQDVFDAIVTIQKTIPTPTGEHPIKEIYDEPPAQFMTWPCFLNIESQSEVERPSSGFRRTAHTIDMHLLFGAADQKYSVRSRRRWVRVVLDTFDGKLKLGSTINGHAHLTRVEYAPVDLNGTEYIAATFVLRAVIEETLAFAP